MSGLFIDNIRKIILEHVQNEKFGVPELAAEVGLSSSQLLRNIKSATGKTPGEFIKEIRLNEALKLLKENDYTASEVSFRVGFNSPSYFNKCFHDHFGYTPGDVKQMNIPEVTKKTSAAELNMDSGKIQNKTKSKKKTILITFITTLLLIIASYIIYNYFTDLNIKKTSEINIPEKSIAVLPFKNLSDNKNNQYFADGVMNDILNHLSAIKGFKVISITTMEQYRSTKKTAPKIGKELKVSYILESSIQKYKDSIKIVSQLIDAKNDKHLWSKKFERELENIFALESEIAREIAAELKITLTPAEIKKIEKVPTKNL
ncbi:MAG: helix-turn-helix domain-containing protein, partial [Bacteroidota bacterium]